MEYVKPRNHEGDMIFYYTELCEKKQGILLHCQVSFRVWMTLLHLTGCSLKISRAGHALYFGVNKNTESNGESCCIMLQNNFTEKVKHDYLPQTTCISKVCGTTHMRRVRNI